jgi:hypothetical protein
LFGARRSPILSAGQPINRRLLTERVGALDARRGAEICRSLEALADC